MNDANAIALATVDAAGLPNVRMVLLKEIEARAFVFYTNYGSKKGQELAVSGKAAFVLHWKSLRRQIRVRGPVLREEGPSADAYYASRSLKSRLGAWASRQSEPLASRASLMAEVAKVTAQHHGMSPNGRRSGVVSAFSLWRWNSGLMAPSGCMTVFAGSGKMLMRNGKFRKLNP